MASVKKEVEIKDGHLKLCVPFTTQTVHQDGTVEVVFELQGHKNRVRYGGPKAAAAAGNTPAPEQG